jgi:hypothetical protein
MHLEQSFAVQADPDRTFEYLLDVNRVAGCVPGISSVEALGSDTFVGTLKVKVGPIGVTYRGNATITSRDPVVRRATFNAEGTEGVGAGRVHALAVMAVTPDGQGSIVVMTAELEIAGRLAQFGRGIIEGVAKRLIGQMADCIRLQLEGSDQALV